MLKIAGLLLVLAGTAAVALAQPVPEIDATTATSGLALLTGAILILRARKRK